MMSTCDKYTQSYIGWEHKFYDPITGTNSGLYTSAGALDMVKAQAIARTFPLAVAGQGPAYSFDYTNARFSMTYTLSLNATAPTTVFISTGLWYVAGYNASVTSQPPNSVAWSVEHHPASAPVAPKVASTAGVPPTPFGYDLLHVVPSASAPAGDAIYVTIVISPA